MPELPEVEVVKKSLKKTIYDLKIKNIEIPNKFLRYKINEKLMKEMIGSKVLSVSRRSKYILINLNNNFTIMVHLGMTGKIVITGADKKEYKTSFYYNLTNYKSKHDHLILEFNKNVLFTYNDVRKFGFIKILKTKNLYSSSHLHKLGPEPLSKKFNSHYFKNNIIKRQVCLKDLLMNQKFLAGLGNIYVNEALFLSKINPKVRSNQIPLKQIKSLISNIKRVLKKAIQAGGSSIQNFNNIAGKKGKFQQFFNVYGKQGSFCSRSNCKGIIKRIRISNRSTFYCDKCQK